MKPEDRIETYTLAIETWGEMAQVEMMIEECSELIHALQKYKRRRIAMKDVCEELADVTIMLEQMRLIFPARVVDHIIEEKFLRLENKLKPDCDAC